MREQAIAALSAMILEQCDRYGRLSRGESPLTLDAEEAAMRQCHDNIDELRHMRNRLEEMYVS